ncbi:MAG TPA: DUF2520 domain-containing protein [Pyrinomonadaceae bacterium]|jgi:predicted short-subunit dehydrogenase-like oxidoreductase (DUF2520 family)|nr:DUF2520 domain-containing protein [Pyrinomonadaceae bacterium]
MPIEKRPKAEAVEARKRPRSNQRKPTISIIGAGRLGTALALALAGRGYRIEAMVARRLSHARRAAALLRTGAPKAVSVTRLDLLPKSDLLLLTTPDDAIAPVAACLAETFGGKALKAGRRTALHCSGALSSDVLAPLVRVGFRVGSMHPLVSISEPLQGAALLLRGAFFCIEGDAMAVRAARAVVRDLEGRSFSIHGRDKALYHAAAVTASGHMVALFDIATEMLEGCGLDPRRARAVLLPLVRSTLENLSTQDAGRALTGTFARADVATVRNHLAALAKLPLRSAMEAYLLLGQRSLQLAGKNGADPAALEQIARMLSRARKNGP